jgi:hypothetical protein
MRLLIAMLTVLVLSLPSNAADELTVKGSKYPVKETVDRLAAALKDKGITPVARVDHAAAAKGVGLELKPTEVLLFGNPKLGTPLMQVNRHIAIDLPMKVLERLGYAGAQIEQARQQACGRKGPFDAGQPIRDRLIKRQLRCDDPQQRIESRLDHSTSRAVALGDGRP